MREVSRARAAPFVTLVMHFVITVCGFYFVFPASWAQGREKKRRIAPHSKTVCPHYRPKRQPHSHFHHGTASISLSRNIYRSVTSPKRLEHRALKPRHPLNQINMHIGDASPRCPTQPCLPFAPPEKKQRKENTGGYHGLSELRCRACPGSRRRKRALLLTHALAAPLRSTDRL